MTGYNISVRKTTIQAITEEVDIMRNTEIEEYKINTPINQPLKHDYFDEWLNWLDVKPKTAETYRKSVNQFLVWLNLNGITTPTRDDVIAWRNNLEADHKAATVQTYITSLRQFFSWTADRGIYPDITKHVKGTKVSHEHKKGYLTSGQCKTLLKHIDRSTLKGLRDYAMITLMMTTGLRTIEVSRANVGDLQTVADFTALYIQGKGKDEKADYVKVPEQVEAAIRDYLTARGSSDESEPLFTSTSHNNTGGRMTTRAISAAVKDRMKEAGFNSDRLTAHSLRHTAGTLALLSGESVVEVQQMLRHANVETTMIYVHTLDKAQNDCSSKVANAIF
jgi:integrase/recombinase XerC